MTDGRHVTAHNGPTYIFDSNVVQRKDEGTDRKRDGWTDGQTFGQRDIRMDRWRDGREDRQTDRRIDGWTDAW